MTLHVITGHSDSLAGITRLVRSCVWPWLSTWQKSVVQPPSVVWVGKGFKSTDNMLDMASFS